MTTAFLLKIPCNYHIPALPYNPTLGEEENTMTNILDTINNNLQDTLSLVILLENDLQQQHADEVYQRTIHVIHEQLKSAIQNIEIANANK